MSRRCCFRVKSRLPHRRQMNANAARQHLPILSYRAPEDRAKPGATIAAPDLGILQTVQRRGSSPRQRCPVPPAKKTKVLQDYFHASSVHRRAVRSRSPSPPAPSRRGAGPDSNKSPIPPPIRRQQTMPARTGRARPAIRATRSSSTGILPTSERECAGQALSVISARTELNSRDLRPSTRRDAAQTTRRIGHFLRAQRLAPDPARLPGRRIRG